MQVQDKRVPFGLMARRAYWVWRGSPSLTVPAMFASGLTALSESIVGLFGLALIVRLEGTGWLQAIASDLGRHDYSALGQVVGDPQFLTITLEYLLPASLLALVVYIIAGGFVFSAEFGSYWQAKDGPPVGISDVMNRFVENWRPMVKTVVLSWSATFAPMVAGFGLFLLVLYIFPSPEAVVFAALAPLTGLAFTGILAVFLIYTPVAVVAERLSGWGAMRASIRLASRNPGLAFTYGLVYLVVPIVISYMARTVTFYLLPVTSLVSVCLLLMVYPVLHLTKTEAFAELSRPDPVQVDTAHPPALVDLLSGLPRTVWAKLKLGVVELKRFAFARENLGYHILSAGGLVLGLGLGIWMGNNGLTKLIYDLGYVPGKINPIVSGSPPLSEGVDIFFHNWQASVATALSGIWFPVFPFATLLLNGALIGIVSDLVPNQTMLAAALVPHGLIEIPSFVLAGSAGIRLGVSFLASVRGSDPAKVERLHLVARQTVYTLVGLILLFFIAGFIEGSITPAIMRLVGWT